MTKNKKVSWDCHQGGVVLRDADGDDIGLVLDGLVEPEEGEVVLECLGVELGVAGHDLDFSVDVLETML